MLFSSSSDVMSKDLTATFGDNYTPLIEEKLDFLPGDSKKSFTILVIAEREIDKPF